MNNLGYAAAVFAAVVMLSGGAALARVCQTDHMTCATTMPMDGYCECHARGNSEDGTVVSRPPPHSKMNATAGGCGSNPNSTGCR